MGCPMPESFTQSVLQLCDVESWLGEVPKDPVEAVKYWKTVLNLSEVFKSAKLGKKIYQAWVSNLSLKGGPRDVEG